MNRIFDNREVKIFTAKTQRNSFETSDVSGAFSTVRWKWHDTVLQNQSFGHGRIKHVGKDIFRGEFE
jgi:hypothetical protein